MSFPPDPFICAGPGSPYAEAVSETGTEKKSADDDEENADYQFYDEICVKIEAHCVHNDSPVNTDQKKNENADNCIVGMLVPLESFMSGVQIRNLLHEQQREQRKYAGK
jgi:hypothetical protein